MHKNYSTEAVSHLRQNKKHLLSGWMGFLQGSRGRAPVLELASASGDRVHLLSESVLWVRGGQGSSLRTSRQGGP